MYIFLHVRRRSYSNIYDFRDKEGINKSTAAQIQQQKMLCLLKNISGPASDSIKVGD